MTSKVLSILCYLFFFDIRILITPLVSSNSFYDVTDVIPNNSGFFFQPTIKWKKNDRRQCQPSCSGNSFASVIEMVIKNNERFLGSNLQCCLHATLLLAVKYLAELNKLFCSQGLESLSSVHRGFKSLWFCYCLSYSLSECY